MRKKIKFIKDKKLEDYIERALDDYYNFTGAIGCSQMQIVIGEYHIEELYQYLRHRRKKFPYKKLKKVKQEDYEY